MQNVIAGQTQVHDVIAADSAVVHDNVWRDGLIIYVYSTQYSIPQDHRATAFHCMDGAMNLSVRKSEQNMPHRRRMRPLISSQ